LSPRALQAGRSPPSSTRRRGPGPEPLRCRRVSDGLHRHHHLAERTCQDLRAVA